MYADLEHCTVTKLVDDALYAQERYGSLDDLNQVVLSNLDFDSLMEIDLDEVEEHEPQENVLPTDEPAAHDPTNYLAPYEPEMLRSIRDGKVNCVYVCRMRQISGKERHLYSFFKRLMQRGVQVTATEYSLRDRVNMFRLARRIERYATRKGLQLPW